MGQFHKQDDEVCMKRQHLCLTLFVIAVQLLITVPASAQYSVTIEPDTILAGEAEARIIVQTSRTDLGLNAVARKGGGNFTDFKIHQSESGTVQQASFTSPYAGEVLIEVLDGKFNKLGSGIVYVMAPIVEIMEEESLNQFNGRAKSMPLMVRVVDHRDELVKNAKLICRLSEKQGNKFGPTTTKVSAFEFKGTHYEAQITGLRDASYKVEVVDLAHWEAHDKADNPDDPHPIAVIEGLNITIE